MGIKQLSKLIGEHAPSAIKEISMDALFGRAAALRRVDAFVKAYYVPWGPELRRWALSHPEVGRPAVAAVVAAVGEAAGVARRARAAFGAALDAELAAGE